MTDLRKAAEMALEFVEWLCGDDHSVRPKNKALDVRKALLQALAQPDLAKVGEVGVWGHKREWVGLTDDEFTAIARKYSLSTRVGLEYFKDELEAKLKEKNT